MKYTLIIIFICFCNTLNCFSQSFLKYGFEVTPSKDMSMEMQTSDETGNLAYAFQGIERVENYAILYKVTVIIFKDSPMDTDTYIKSLMKEYSNLGSKVTKTTYKNKPAVIAEENIVVEGIDLKQRLLMFLCNKSGKYIGYTLVLTSNAPNFESIFLDYKNSFKLL